MGPPHREIQNYLGPAQFKHEDQIPRMDRWLFWFYLQAVLGYVCNSNKVTKKISIQTSACLKVRHVKTHEMMMGEICFENQFVAESWLCEGGEACL